MSNFKIAIGGINQETNTFSPLRTTFDNFKNGYYYEGPEIISHLRHTRTEAAGFIRVLEKKRVKIIPTICAWALPAGPVKQAVLNEIIARLLKKIRAVRRLDGVLLSLHGAMVAENEDDVEGYLLEKIREALPAEAKIVCSLDSHANVTGRMIRHADMLVGYKTYPHEDTYETGRKAAQIICKLIKRKERIIKLAASIPMIMPVENSQTDSKLMKPIMAALRKTERSTGAYSASIFLPHPWLDTGDYRPCALAYAKKNENAFKQQLHNIARRIWNNRRAFYITMPSCAEALKQSAAAGQHPVIWIDSGDIVAAGAPGDSNEILKFLIRHAPGLKSLLAVYAPEAARALRGAPSHEKVRLRVGGKITKDFTPLPIEGTLLARSNKGYTYRGPYLRGIKVQTGMRIVLKIKNITLVLMEHPEPAHDPAFFQSLGLKPENMDIIVVKSHNTFKPAYRKISTNIIRLDTRGITNPDVHSLEYKNIPRPIYPLNKNMKLNLILGKA